MAAVSLLTIRTSVRQESDNVNSQFVTDAELNGYIRTAYAALYGKIVQAFGNDYFVQTPAAGYTFSTDGINQLFALPTPFFKLLGVDLQTSAGVGQYVSLREFAFADRNVAGFANSQVPMAGQTVRVLYVPQPTLPTQDADTIDGVNSWEESIVIDVAIVALTKEESDISALLVRRKAMDDRLDSEIENRNASVFGGTIVDTSRLGAPGMRYRLNGNSLWLVGGTTPAPYGDGWAYGNGWGY